ncbi:sigma-70 family RNA polymerase sigma factor [Chelatococcus sambhunathii]|uniref:RNA polymerase sigma factor n=1 Tax=Chelatococcus sambhunathii TaxID=363953 RepID=A0ABU1DEC2_9HYPH|nr:sigma-70 family RNA polymerase sigma factor [Chelatococcus sambhunathii]MDR4306468.1 sigma-70 family RNA polymerase sigma factor [Chelatococcus sambhunathii]
MFGKRREDPQFDVIGQLRTLRRYALTLTRNEHDAEDLVQDALVRAYAKRSQYDTGRELRSWLLAILHNAYVDKLRSVTADRRRAEEAASLAEFEVGPSQEHAAQLTGVLEAVKRLPEDQRAALHLVAIEGLSYADASAVLDVPLGTLMSRIGRARETLRRIEGGESARLGRLRLVGGSDELG